MRTTPPALRAAVAALALAAAGCSGPSPGGGTGQVRVVTTVSPLTSLAANVAGGAAVVVGLVPEGVNSHTFDPPPSAARELSRADVVFVNGLKLEDTTTKLAREVAGDAEIVALGDRTIPPGEHIYDFSFPREGGKPNPHLWTSPPLARRYAEIMAETLAREDADGADTYRANFRALAAKIDALDAAMRRATATVPPERRVLLTYHDAYAYFARHYGYRVIGAIQLSDFEDPSPQEVARLIGQVRRLGVPAVFGSEVFPSPVLEQIGRESGARYVDVLRDDDLPGEPGDPDHSYLGLMRFDFRTIVASLGGDPAPLDVLDVTDVVPDRARYPQ